MSSPHQHHEPEEGDRGAAGDLDGFVERRGLTVAREDEDLVFGVGVAGFFVLRFPVYLAALFEFEAVEGDLGVGGFCFFDFGGVFYF